MRDIENISSVDEVREELKMQTKSFSLFDFYMKNVSYDYAIDCALGIITPKQNLYCYSYGEHSHLFEKICSSLYDNFYDLFKINGYNWVDTVLDLNCIALRLVSKHYSLVWIPEQITSYQYEQLYKFYVKMYNVNYSLLANGYKPISIMTNVKDECGFLNLKKALPYIFTRINNDVETRDEHIIVPEISKNKMLCKQKMVSKK